MTPAGAGGLGFLLWFLTGQGPAGVPDERGDRNDERGEAMSDEKYHVNLNDLAEVSEISATTLRKLIARHADFPVLERGSNGVPYSFDAREVKAWLDHHQSEKDAATEAHREELAALQLELYGPPVDDEAITRLTPQQRQQLAGAKFRENQLSEQQGLLVRADEVEATLEAALAILRKDMQALVDQIARELGLERAPRNAVADRVKAALDRCASKIERLDADRNLAA